MRVHEGAVWVGDRVVAKGAEHDAAQIAAAVETARAGLAVQLESFAANTMDYLRRERDLLLDRVGVPDIGTEMDGRQALIVVRGHHYKEDLATLRPYIREYRPVLIGVDGGADAILDAGYRPDMVVGDMDSVTDRALTCGAEIVVHAYRDGRAPGLERVRELGIDPVVFPAAGTSEDVAMLLADDKGASLIVAVGTHCGLVEFLDKGRSGMASTFLTRLRVGGKLVDAKGVSRLYRQRISNLQLAVLAVAGLLALAVALSATSAGQTFYGLVGRAPRRPVPVGHRILHGAAARSPLVRPPVAHLMIDFRYHLVSLVSVFLALAVGIVLGAGPLKEPIATGLTQSGRLAAADRDEQRNAELGYCPGRPSPTATLRHPGHAGRWSPTSSAAAASSW